MSKQAVSTFIAALLMVACLCFAPHAQAQAVNLTLASFFPATHFVNTKMVKQWVDEIKEATNGEVKITTYPAQTLLTAKETYDGVVSGTADIGIVSFAYTRGRFPVMEAFEIPGVYFGSCTATGMVATEGVKHFNPKELSDTKLMFIYAPGPGSLYTKKEVKSLSDLSGMRIRATGLTAKSIKALGATPVAMGMPDVYEALSKGVIDGNIAPPEVLKGFKQAEITRYITILPPVYNALHCLAMNKKKWESLSPKVRQAIEKINAEFVLKAGQMWDGQMKENGIDYGINDYKMKINRLSDADYDKAGSLMQPILDDYVARMNKKGLPGKDILDFVKQKAAIYSKQYPARY